MRSRGVVAPLEACRRPGGVRVGRHQLLLRRPDDVEERIHEVVGPQRVPEQRRSQLVEDRLDVQPPLGGVGDAEHRRDAEEPAPLAHDPERERVVVGERRVVGEAAVRPLDTVAHLVGGLARVGQHELAAGADAESRRGGGSARR